MDGVGFAGPHNLSQFMHEKTSDYDSFFSGEGDLVDPTFENSPGGAEAVEDESDDEVDVEELERRMWRDRMRLKRLKEKQMSKTKDVVGPGGADMGKQRQAQEQARRKKMSRAQDGILKYMLKMMEVCNAQGFVYGNFFILYLRAKILKFHVRSLVNFNMFELVITSLTGDRLSIRTI